MLLLLFPPGRRSRDLNTYFAFCFSFRAKYISCLFFSFVCLYFFGSSSSYMMLRRAFVIFVCESFFLHNQMSVALSFVCFPFLVFFFST